MKKINNISEDDDSIFGFSSVKKINHKRKLVDDIGQMEEEDVVVTSKGANQG